MLKRLNLVASAARPVALAALLCLAAAPGALGASEEARGRTPDDILDGLSLLKRGAAGRILSRGAAIDLLMDHRAYPGECATPLLIALSQSRARIGLEGLGVLRALGPIPGSFEDAYPSARESFSGSFRLSFSTRPNDPAALSPEDGDLDGVPDEARAILERLDAARREVLETFAGSQTPVARPDGEEGIHRVEIAELPGRLGGYVWSQGGESLLVLDKGRLDSADGDAILRHQIAHLLQIGLTGDESPWWYEAHAIWAEDPAGARAADRAAGVTAYLRASGEGMEPREIRAWEGTFLWPHYLVAAGSQPAILGAMWEEMSALPGNNTLQAMGRSLKLMRGTSIEEEVRAFRIWNVFLGDLDDGNHYPFASELPGATWEHVRDYPASWQGHGPVARLGGEVLQLTAMTSPGGWILGFSADPLPDWDVTLLTIPAYLGGRPGLAELPVEEGLAGTAVPWNDLAGVLVVVQNLGPGPSAERDEPGMFSLDAAYDPLVPFDLMSFSATDEGGGSVALRWHTEREMSMLGWQIYRSRDPVEGFEPIQKIMVPAVGGEEATSYMIIDRDLVPGRKYYYLLEGITEEGFREVAYPVSVRVR